MRKIIFFELNEVPFQVVDYFCKQNPTSTLNRILSKCAQYETVNGDEGHLSPWITWPTVHRGVTNHLHKIKDFGEDLSKVDQQYPPIWKILHQQKVTTGVFASMHSFPPPANYQDYSFYVPDPFAGESMAHPQKLMPFQRFNLAMSRKSGRNVDTGIDLKSASELMLSLPSIGVKTNTMIDVASQIVTERVKPWIKTRRRTFQTILAFDVFMKLLKKNKPAFCTYFSNHVASAMHRYWAATFPNEYDQYNLSPEWKETYKGEIEWTMKKFDAFLTRLVGFVGQHPEYKLVISSSMGQQATEAELILTESYCKDFDKFMTFIGLSAEQWERRNAMHPQYNVQVNAEKVAFVKQKLDAISINNAPLQFREKDGGFFSIDLGHRNLTTNYAVVNGQNVPFEQMGLTNEAIDDETGSTAYHVPEGILLIYDTQKPATGERKKGVSSTAITPSILQGFGIKPPAYMTAERINELV